ncbi:putative tissue-type plasminogen activator isoform X1 [Sesbania bispinosa]|nr:putative tissue-type plasminogen activator isoform X1 [Sesbania bispinosa]
MEAISNHFFVAEVASRVALSTTASLSRCHCVLPVFNQCFTATTHRVVGFRERKWQWRRLGHFVSKRYCRVALRGVVTCHVQFYLDCVSWHMWNGLLCITLAIPSLI